MTLVVGQSVVYPNRGPCRVGAVIKKYIGGRPESFYPLVLLDDSGEVVFVPVTKVASVGLRRLLNKLEVAQLLKLLSDPIAKNKPAIERKNWQQRSSDQLHLLASGSAFDLATLVKSLSEADKIKKLAPRDREVLDKARKQLICEIAEVTGTAKSAVAEQINAIGGHNLPSEA